MGTRVPKAGAAPGIAALARELAEAAVGGAAVGRAALPEAAELARLVDAAKELLRSEPASLRPRDSSGRPGGLVKLPELPAVLVPDLHARPSFIAEVLAWSPPASDALAARAPLAGRATLADLLEKDEASLVCLGDLFHSEWGQARARWERAYREFLSGWRSRLAMDEEMTRALATARIVLEAKLAFPASFHYLKGNHDNIVDEEGRGDHSFYKFAAEGEMVASWFELTYGRKLLESYRELELELPVLALGGRFVASHGEPAFALTREDAIEYRSRPEVVEALIWTANGAAAPGSVAVSMEALLGPAAAGALWFAGHRPVQGRYALRAGGRFVQFHDPGAHRVAYLLPDRAPDPERDIRDID
jgi:hypothetical protein